MVSLVDIEGEADVPRDGLATRGWAGSEDGAASAKRASRRAEIPDPIGALVKHADGIVERDAALERLTAQDVRGQDVLVSHFDHPWTGQIRRPRAATVSRERLGETIHGRGVAVSEAKASRMSAGSTRLGPGDLTVGEVTANLPVYRCQRLAGGTASRAAHYGGIEDRMIRMDTAVWSGLPCVVEDRRGIDRRAGSVTETLPRRPRIITLHRRTRVCRPRVVMASASAHGLTLRRVPGRPCSGCHHRLSKE
jgi:hypothetical protein